MTSLLFVALLFLFVVPLVFIWHDVYDDGVFGRISLGGVVLMSFISMVLILDGHKICDPSEATLPLALAWLTIAYSVFITWHLFRFHRRVLHAQQNGKAFMQRSHS